MCASARWRLLLGSRLWLYIPRWRDAWKAMKTENLPPLLCVFLQKPSSVLHHDFKLDAVEIAP